MRLRRLLTGGLLCAVAGSGAPIAAGAASPAADGHAPAPQVSHRASAMAATPVLGVPRPVPGDRGPHVTALQAALIARGFTIPAGATGFYGSQTSTAVAAFQRAQGWQGAGADGVPGPMTLSLLGLPGVTAAPVPPAAPPPAPAPAPAPAPNLVPGASGAHVADLQRALIAAGFPPAGGADGVYGPQTTRAVSAFQLAQGWRGAGADGVPGPLTLQRLRLPGEPRPTPAADARSHLGPPATPALALPPAQFVERYQPAALQISQTTGVPALVSLAQAALESGWGASAPEYNFFGIKAKPQDTAKTARITIETLPTPDSPMFTDVIAVTPRPDGLFDYAVREWFRTYSSPEDAFQQHAQLLAGNPRYGGAFAHRDDAYAFAAAVAAAGYATDPGYTETLHKVMRLIEGLG